MRTLMHLLAALPADPAHCVAGRLEADFWWVIKGLITIACAGGVAYAWMKTKQNLVPTLGAFIMAALIFWGTVLGGVITLGVVAQDTLSSAGATAQSTPLGGPTACSTPAPASTP